MLLCCRDKYHSSTLVALLIIHYPMPAPHIAMHSRIVPNATRDLIAANMD